MRRRAPTIGPRRWPPSTPSPTSIRRVSRRANSMGPLVAQNRTYVRYEVRINRGRIRTRSSLAAGLERDLAPSPQRRPHSGCRIDRGEGGVADSDRRRHARRPQPLLCRQGRASRSMSPRRCAAGRPCLRRARRRPRRPAYRGQDEISAAMAMEHVRARRQRAARRRRRRARAGRERRERALFVQRSRQGANRRRAAVGLALAQPVGPPTRRRSTRSRRRSCAGIRSIPRPWR